MSERKAAEPSEADQEIARAYFGGDYQGEEMWWAVARGAAMSRQQTAREIAAWLRSSNVDSVVANAIEHKWGGK